MLNLFDKLVTYNQLMDAADRGQVGPDEFATIMHTLMEDPEFLKIVSARAIDLGVVEELSVKGYQNVILQIAHKVATVSVALELSRAPKPESSNDYYDVPGFGESLRELDKIIVTTSLATGVPVNKINQDLDVAIRMYTDQMVNALYANNK